MPQGEVSVPNQALHLTGVASGVSVVQSSLVPRRQVSLDVRRSVSPTAPLEFWSRSVDLLARYCVDRSASPSTSLRTRGTRSAVP